MIAKTQLLEGNIYIFALQLVSRLGVTKRESGENPELFLKL